MRHRFSVHPDIRNKPAHWQPTFASHWQARQGELEDLKTHVSQGGAFIPAAMSSSHRSGQAFDSASLAVIDIDDVLSIAAFRSHPLAQHTAWVYTSARHDNGFRLWNYDTGERLGVWVDRDAAEQALAVHKQQEPGADFKILDSDRFRVVFQLPEPIDDPDIYQCLIKHLTQELGGDKATSNPCNIFYGNDHAEHPLWQPETVLPYQYITAAQQSHAADVARKQQGAVDYDDRAIARATYILEHILDPTKDGQRAHFIRVTAAAASAGDVLFPVWSDWASRGHHGSGRNSWQAREKFFRGFKGRSSLRTLEYLCTEQDSRWWERLPEDIRRRQTDAQRETRATGYDPEDFHGGMQRLFEEEPPTPRTQTVSMLDPDALATIKPATPQASAAGSKQQGDGTDPVDTTKPGDPPGDDGAKPARKPNKDDYIGLIKDRLLALYPKLRLNLLTQRIECGPPGQPQRIHGIGNAYIRISRGQKDVYPKNTVLNTAEVVAWENRYNPVKDYLEGVLTSAQPIDYLDRVASELLGLSDDVTLNPFTPEGVRLADVTIKRFLVGAVARALEPGCVHDWMLILVGAPNVGKSNFFYYLTPPDTNNPGIYPWTNTIQQGIGYLKERPQTLHAGWIVLLDEVERYFKRRYVEELKNLVGVPVDRARRLYENEEDYPRSFVLAGNANTTDFLADPTGNRRFMPIYVTGKVPSREDASTRIIDLDRVKRDRDGIWAAAYRSYLDNPIHTFSSGETQWMEEYKSAFTRDSSLENKVLSLLEYRNSGVYQGRSYVLLSDLMGWLNTPIESQGRLDQPVSDALRRAGYEPRRIRVGPRQLRAWLKRLT